MAARRPFAYLFFLLSSITFSTSPSAMHGVHYDNGLVPTRLRTIPVHSKSLVGRDGFVGEEQSAALAVAYHRLNRIEQVISRCVGIAELAYCLQVVPGNPKRIFNQCWHRFRHKA